MKKGMTLLEVLISLTIFAFTALYISKVFNKSLTQKFILAQFSALGEAVQ